MKKIFLITLIFLSTISQLKPRTNIIVGNYTNKTIKMTYKQTGENKLRKNNEFKVFDTIIKPNQEKKVFEISRNVGIKNKKKYRFDFRFKGRPEMRFVVKLEGKNPILNFTGSTMKQRIIINATNKKTKYTTSKGLQTVEVIDKDGKRIRFDCNRWLKSGDIYDNLEFFLYEY